MPTEKKIREVEALRDRLNRSSVVIGAEYRGMKVHESTSLRRLLRDAGLEMEVVKNTLFLRAANAAGVSEAGELVEGPTAIIFGFDDPLVPIKTVVEYQRQARNTFAARKAYVDGQVINSSQISDLATLPSKDVLIGQIAGALQSPITDFVMLMQATIQEFSGLLEARSEQLEGAA